MDAAVPPLDRLLACCAERGVDLAGYRRDFVSRRLVRTAMLAGEIFLDRTVDRLADDPAALERFLEDLSISTSTFFRDALPFAWLEQVVVPALDREAGPIRVWSAGCAAGEEAWSLAMLLKERRDDFEVVASDRNERLIEAALRGRYDEEQLAQVRLGRLRRFFTADGRSSFRVCDELRPHVRFVRQELASSPPPGEALHLVLCRNVLIYLAPEGRRFLLEGIARSLVDGGVVMLGEAEAMPDLAGLREVPVPVRAYRKETPCPPIR